ncbi:hypothetical protein D9M71_294910 [compost metagenome]
MEQRARGFQPLELGHLQGQLVALVFTGQAVEGGGQFGDRHHPGHGGTAFERVQGTLQVIADRRVVATGALQINLKAGQMALRLGTKNAQQLRIEAIDTGSRRGIVFGQAVQVPGQLLDFSQLRQLAGGKVGQQVRQVNEHLLQRYNPFRGEHAAALEHPVQQVLGAPGQFSHRLGMHHAATAFECMQRATHFAQRLALLVVGTPAQPVALDFRQQLARFIKEHLAKLVIDAVATAVQVCAGPNHRALHTQRRQAGPRHLDKGLAIGQRVGCPPLQVAFGSAQRLSQVRQLINRRLFLQVLQPTLHIACAADKQLGHGGQHQHGQCPADLLQQPRQGLQALPGPVGLQVIANQILGLLQHVQRFMQHQLAYLRQVRAWQAALAAFLQRADHAVQGGLHVQQGPRHVHQHRVVHRPLALSQCLQRQHLVDDHPPRLLKAQYRQGISHVAQRCQQRIELLAVLTVAAAVLVQALLDAHQVVAQCSHHRTQRIAP